MKRFPLFASIGLYVWALFAFSIGCGGGGDPVQPSTQSLPQNSYLIKKDVGGTVVLDKAKIQIPANALEQDTIITIETGLTDVLSLGDIVKIKPENLKFKLPIKVALSFEQNKFPQDFDMSLLTVSSWDGSKWDDVSSVLSTDSLSISGNTSRGFIFRISKKIKESISLDEPTIELNDQQQVVLTAASNYPVSNEDINLWTQVGGMTPELGFDYQVTLHRTYSLSILNFDLIVSTKMISRRIGYDKENSKWSVIENLNTVVSFNSFSDMIDYVTRIEKYPIIGFSEMDSVSDYFVSVKAKINGSLSGVYNNESPEIKTKYFLRRDDFFLTYIPAKAHFDTIQKLQ